MKNRGCYLFFLSFLLILIGSMHAMAVPAYPSKVTVMTQDGKMVEIYIRGDENFKYGLSIDNYTLLSDSVGWWYASCEDGNIVKSDFHLMPYDEESKELIAFKSSCPKQLLPASSFTPSFNRTQSGMRATNNGSITGERRALVILMQYKDKKFSKTNDDFVQLFNAINYNEDNAMGSVRDFYRYASQNQLDYISDVYGPYTAINNMSYYGENSTYGGNDAHAVDLCVEAIRNLPDNIDFSQYDNDGDGLIDNVHIVFAGYGEEAGGPSNAIWSHEYPHRIALKGEIGYSLAGYSCTPELRGNWGTKISRIGVVCHELGHALGAMDYYDTNYETGGEYDGTGQWDIMASGSWNDNGRTPPNFNPYVRSTVFGWNAQVVLNPNQHINLPRMEVDNPEQSIIYRVETGKSDDYFLLENRQKYSFDSALPGSGLMIYHVHPNLDRYSSTNTINATSPQGFYPVCASYSEPSKKKYGKINSVECPFPGSKKIRAFTPTTSPAAVAWNGSAAKVSISNITLNSSDGSITFTTGNEIIDEPEEPDLPIEKNLVYQESFEKGINGRMTINSITGKEIWRAYTNGNFVMNAELIPEASDGEKILMLYAGKGSLMNESETVSSDLSVEAGANYTLSFDIYCMANTTNVPTFSLFVEDEYGEYNTYSLNEVTTQWKSIDLPLTFASNTFRYKLYGRVYTGGVFVDNIRLYKEQEMTSVDDISDTTYQPIELYRMDGMNMGNYGITALPSGVYIMRQGKHTRKIVIK